jgi:hypothetical protein
VSMVVMVLLHFILHAADLTSGYEGNRLRPVSRQSLSIYK